MKLFRKDRCYNGGGRHKFEPRYDKVARKDVSFEGYGFTVEDYIRLSTNIIYIYDICKWCAKKVKRDE